AADPVQSKTLRERRIRFALQTEETHPERRKPWHKFLPDSAESQYPGVPAPESASHWAARCAALTNRAVEFRQSAAERDRRHDAPFGDRYRVARTGGRNVCHGNAALFCGGEIDAFESRAPL